MFLSACSLFFVIFHYFFHLLFFLSSFLLSCLVWLFQFLLFSLIHYVFHSVGSQIRVEKSASVDITSSAESADKGCAGMESRFLMVNEIFLLSEILSSYLNFTLIFLSFSDLLFFFLLPSSSLLLLSYMLMPVLIFLLSFFFVRFLCVRVCERDNGRRKDCGFRR